MLSKKLLNLKKLSVKEKEVLKKKISTSDFITIENDYRTLPNKILTSKGILEVIEDFEIECDRKSELTNRVSFGRINSYTVNWYINKESYQIYLNLIMSFFINNKDIFLDYLNAKYPKLNLTLDDITASGIKKQVETKYLSEKIPNKRNNKYKKGDIFIRKGNDIFMVTKDKEIYLLKEKRNETRRNISESKFRRNGMFYSDEGSIRSSVSI